MNLRRIVQALALAGLASVACVPPVLAQDKGDWLIRGRLLSLDSANKDSTPLNLSINNKVFPEVDISYFFSPNLAAELVLTYPQKQDLRSNGANIGSFKHLPPTLSLQYHWTGMGFRPYVGAGLNYTHLSNVSFNPAINTALGPTVKKNSYGLAIGAGFDVPIGGGWLFNVDVKKVQIKTDVSSFGKGVGTFKVDPTLFSLGVGYRF